MLSPSHLIFLSANPAIAISLELAIISFPTMQFCFSGGIFINIFHAIEIAEKFYNFEMYEALWRTIESTSHNSWNKKM